MLKDHLLCNKKTKWIKVYNLHQAVKKRKKCMDLVKGLVIGLKNEDNLLLLKVST